MVSEKKKPLFVGGWDRKNHPRDPRLSSLGKPREIKRCSSGQVFLSYPHTYDGLL